MPDSDPLATSPAPPPATPPVSPASGKWGDLGIRVISATVMVAVTAAALWVGGPIWALLVTAVAVLMGWELARLCEPGIQPSRAQLLAASLALPLALLAAGFLTGQDAETIRSYQYASWGVMLLPPLLGIFLLKDAQWIWVAYGFVIQFGAQFFLFTGLDPWGFAWLIVVVGVVILSDTLGYFAGRLIGGPKFWPRVSPKKTWSGTIAGWIGAAIFGAFVVGGLLGSAPVGALAAVVVAFAGQMGDIAASAIKRRVGVKDASHLIPGHGGFMDRLDAMIAAAAVTIVFALVF